MNTRHISPNYSAASAGSALNIVAALLVLAAFALAIATPALASSLILVGALGAFAGGACLLYSEVRLSAYITSGSCMAFNISCAATALATSLSVDRKPRVDLPDRAPDLVGADCRAWGESGRQEDRARSEACRLTHGAIKHGPSLRRRAPGARVRYDTHDRQGSSVPVRPIVTWVPRAPRPPRMVRAKVSLTTATSLSSGPSLSAKTRPRSMVMPRAEK